MSEMGNAVLYLLFDSNTWFSSPSSSGYKTFDQNTIDGLLYEEMIEIKPDHFKLIQSYTGIFLLAMTT